MRGSIDSRLKAATLAVGTEVVDGQILDRNSAWLSERCVSAGAEVIEHRAVPDDREKIAQALRELSDKTDLLFVTGGLGPTSDDFTRDLIAEVYAAPLEFHEPSWQKIVKRFEARGAVAKPIQRQQCFFPRGSTVLENPQGTANAFSMKVDRSGRAVSVFVLPGPPIEIAAVWELHLAKQVESLVPADQREDLFLWQTLGCGEGDIAEKVEEAIAGSGLRVGYRVHLPYVEVKLWVLRSQTSSAKPFVERIETALSPWLVARGKDDPADRWVRAAFEGRTIEVQDRVTGGYVHSRLQESAAKLQKESAGQAPKGSLLVSSALMGFLSGPAGAAEIVISLESDPVQKHWLVKMAGQQTLAIAPTSLYNFGSERGHKYAAEKMFHALRAWPPFAQKKD